MRGIVLRTKLIIAQSHLADDSTLGIVGPHKPLPNLVAGLVSFLLSCPPMLLPLPIL